jgi:hypothetical protein
MKTMRLSKILALAVMALMAMPNLGVVIGAQSLEVRTDSEYYAPGEYVEIEGKAAALANLSILVYLNNTLETVYELNITADEDGEYSTLFQLSEEAAEGLYNVTASLDGDQAQAYFFVQPENESEEESTEVTQGEEETKGQEGTSEEEDDESEGTEEEAEEEPEEETSTEEATEKAMGLKNAIQRARDYAEKIEEITQRLEENGRILDETQQGNLEENITKALQILGEAESFLEPDSFNAEAVAQKLSEARGILGETMGYLNRSAKKQKAANFIENVEEQINSMEDKIIRIGDRLAKGKLVLAALQARMRQLIRMRERLTEGEVEEVVEALDDLIEGIDEDLGNLNGEGTVAKFKAMNRLEARIRVLNATAERLADRGVDTSELDDQLESAEALVEEMMDKMSEGGTEEAEDLLEEVEDGLKGIGETIRSFKKRGSDA